MSSSQAAALCTCLSGEQHISVCSAHSRSAMLMGFLKGGILPVQTYGVSKEFNFVTPPTPGTDEPVAFFAMADLGAPSQSYLSCP